MVKKSIKKKTAKKKVSKKPTLRQRQAEEKKPVEVLVEEALNENPEDVKIEVKAPKEFNPESFRAQSLEEPEEEKVEVEKTTPKPKAEGLAPGEVKKKWRKGGKGSFLLKIEGENPRWIKGGEVFSAREIDIPQGFRKNIVPLDQINQLELAPVISKTKYIAVISEEDGAKYDIINESTAKLMNNTPLTREEAESTLTSLNG